MKTMAHVRGWITNAGPAGLWLLLLALAVSSCAQRDAQVVESLAATSEAVVASPAAAPAQQLAPAKSTVVVGATQQFKPRKGVFAVSDLSVATITSTGLVTAIAPGVVTVTRTVGKTVDSATLTVVNGKLLAVDVTCGTATPTKIGSKGVTTVGVGALLTCEVTGAYSVAGGVGLPKVQKATIPNTQLNWSSTAPASATVSTVGVVQSIAPGRSEIIATDPTTKIHGGVEIRVDAQPIATLTVTPAIASTPVTTAVQFKAIAMRTTPKGTGRSTTPTDVVWSVADPTIAAVDASGLVVGIAAGTTTVTAVEPTLGIKGTATLKVTATHLTSIEIEPAQAAQNRGPSKPVALPTTIHFGTTIALEALGIFRAAGVVEKVRLALADTIWSSSDDTLATVSADGVVTSVGLVKGRVKITATDAVSGQAAHVTFDVVPGTLKLEISSGKTLLTRLPRGVDVPLTAIAKLVGTKGAATAIDETIHAAWTSSDAKTATVSNLPGSQGVLTTIWAFISNPARLSEAREQLRLEL